MYLPGVFGASAVAGVVFGAFGSVAVAYVAGLLLFAVSCGGCAMLPDMRSPVCGSQAHRNVFGAWGVSPFGARGSLVAGSVFRSWMLRVARRAGLGEVTGSPGND